MKFSSIIMVICGTLLLHAACTKNTFHVTERDIVENNARLKVGLFTPSIGTQGVQIKVNGIRVSNNINYNTPFPGGGLNTGGSNNSDYLSTAAGETQISLSIPKAGTDIDSIKVLDFAQSLESTKRYTLFVTDTFPAAKGVMVMDDVAQPDSGARIKIINLMPNVAAVDFYHKDKLVKGNVEYMKVTEYVDIKFGNDSFHVRAAGAAPTSKPIASRLINTGNQRIYTFFSRGYNGAAGTRAPNVSALIVQ